MLDPLSLRIALSVIAVTLMALTYFTVYRDRPSHYTGWWLASLIATGTSSALYAFNGTPLQVFANPLGNVAGVSGGVLAWAAARSLHRLPLPWAAGAAFPAAVLVASMVDSPATNTWAGGPALLIGLALALTLAAREVATVRREHRDERGGSPMGTDGTRTLATLGAGVGILAVFYWVRAALFLAVGPDHPVFERAVGATPTTLALIVMLVLVTFTMTELSQFEHAHDLRRRATRDALTGLLNREEFMARAAEALAARASRHAVEVADLDHFKRLNDTYGHDAGDRALKAFAQAADLALGPHDLAGRLGGEEFALLLATDSAAIARARVEALSAEYARVAAAATVPATTVSYGVAIAGPDASLSQALRSADAAMYRAKRAGRDQVVVDGQV